MNATGIASWVGGVDPNPCNVQLGRKATIDGPPKKNQHATLDLWTTLMALDLVIFAHQSGQITIMPKPELIKRISLGGSWLLIGCPRLRSL